jgi:ABC-type uncharacterized transport system substrate-binding protein
MRLTELEALPGSRLATVAVCLAPVFVAFSTASNVAAHPHVLVDAKAEIVFDEQQHITAVRNIWQFDEAFTAFAIQGLDTDADGNLSDVELAPLAQENVEALAAYEFFTYLVVGERKHAFMPPREYWDELHDGRLTLTFLLPLEEPVALDQPVDIEIFDPEYFVAITLVNEHPVTLDGAPPSCAATHRPPRELDASTMAALAVIPIDQHDLPADLLEAASALANLIRIECPGLSVLPAAELSARSSSDDASVPAPGVAPAAGSKQHLAPVVAIGLSAILIVAVAVSLVLLRRRLRSAR